MNTKGRPSFEPQILVASYVILLCVGLLEVWSASRYFSYVQHANENFIFVKDLVIVLVSLFVAFVFYLVDYRILKKIAIPVVVFSIVLLVLLYTGLGADIRGSVRWIKIGSVFFEPSEFAKLALIVYLADFISRKKEYAHDFYKGLVPAAMVMGVIFLLIAKESDIGTAFLVLMTFLIVIYVFDYRFVHIMSLLLPSGVVLALILYRNPGKLERVKYFLYKHSLPFQVKQSLIALGSGGLFGAGIGRGMFKSLYLPDAYNDFIIASIGEDLGFVGLMLVLALLVAVVFSIFSVARRCEDTFGKVLAFGIGVMFALQMIINAGTAVYIIPPKGITMPFLSYGGTAMVVNSVMIGIVLNIARHVGVGEVRNGEVEGSW